MIDIRHLFWIVPLCISVGTFIGLCVAALLNAARE